MFVDERGCLFLEWNVRWTKCTKTSSPVSYSFKQTPSSYLCATLPKKPGWVVSEGPCAGRPVILECVQRYFSHSGAQHKPVEISSAHEERTNRNEAMEDFGFWGCSHKSILWSRHVEGDELLHCVFLVWLGFISRVVISLQSRGSSSSFWGETGPREDGILPWRFTTNVYVTQLLSRTYFLQ